MAADVRLIQIARILGLPLRGLDHTRAREAISLRAPEVALAFFLEAVDSDDVTSVESALDYLDGRMAFFQGLVTPSGAATIEAAFREKLRSWA